MLIYSMSVSVDGFIADREGAFGWTAPNADFRATGSGHRSSGGACPIVGRLCTVTGRVVSTGWVRRRWWVVVV